MKWLQETQQLIKAKQNKSAFMMQDQAVYGLCPSPERHVNNEFDMNDWVSNINIEIDQGRFASSSGLFTIDTSSPWWDGWVQTYFTYFAQPCTRIHKHIISVFEFRISYYKTCIFHLFPQKYLRLWLVLYIDFQIMSPHFLLFLSSHPTKQAYLWNSHKEDSLWSLPSVDAILAVCGSQSTNDVNHDTKENNSSRIAV
jgi:hypothetical protein